MRVKSSVGAHNQITKTEKRGPQNEAIYPQNSTASRPLTSPGLVLLHVPHNLDAKSQDPHGGGSWSLQIWTVPSRRMGSRYKLRGPGGPIGDPRPDNVAYVFVFLGSIIMCLLYK